MLHPGLDLAAIEKTVAIGCQCGRNAFQLRRRLFLGEFSVAVRVGPHQHPEEMVAIMERCDFLAGPPDDVLSCAYAACRRTANSLASIKPSWLRSRRWNRSPAWQALPHSGGRHDRCRASGRWPAANPPGTFERLHGILRSAVLAAYLLASFLGLFCVRLASAKGRCKVSGVSSSLFEAVEQGQDSRAAFRLPRRSELAVFILVEHLKNAVGIEVRLGGAPPPPTLTLSISVTVSSVCRRARRIPGG